VSVLLEHYRTMQTSTLQQLRNDARIGELAHGVIQQVLDERSGVDSMRNDPGKSETKIRLEIKAWYRQRGAQVYDTEQNRKNPRVDPGLPDLIVVWPGIGIRFIECKSVEGKLRKEQLVCQRATEAAFGIYLVARSVEQCIEFEREKSA
jgi:hypothetical protein